MNTGIFEWMAVEANIHAGLEAASNLETGLAVIGEKSENALRQPVEFAGQAPGGETDVSAFARDFKEYVGGNLIGLWQRMVWQEGVVLCVEHQCRQANGGQPGFA